MIPENAFRGPRWMSYAIYESLCGSMMLNGILGEELLEFARGVQKLKGRLYDAVEHKGGVHEKGETYDL